MIIKYKIKDFYNKKDLGLIIGNKSSSFLNSTRKNQRFIYLIQNKPYSEPGIKSSFWSVCQETTLTKSATNEGISHFKTAALPRIT